MEVGACFEVDGRLRVDEYSAATEHMNGELEPDHAQNQNPAYGTIVPYSEKETVLSVRKSRTDLVIIDAVLDPAPHRRQDQGRLPHTRPCHAPEPPTSARPVLRSSKNSCTGVETSELLLCWEAGPEWSSRTRA